MHDAAGVIANANAERLGAMSATGTYPLRLTLHGVMQSKEETEKSDFDWPGAVQNVQLNREMGQSQKKSKLFEIKKKAMRFSIPHISGFGWLESTRPPNLTRIAQIPFRSIGAHWFTTMNWCYEIHNGVNRITSYLPAFHMSVI
jgi:hypothetical protein